MFDLETYESIVATIKAMSDEMETWDRATHEREMEAVQAHDALVELLTAHKRCHHCGERWNEPVKDGLHCRRCGRWDT